MGKFKESVNDYLAPLWKTEKVINETVMFVGEDDVAELLYEPEEILSVRNYRLDRNYQPDEDYLLEGKRIRRGRNSAIPYWDQQAYYAPDYNVFAIGAKEEICEKMGGKRYLKYGEGDTFTSKQIAVSYIRKDTFAGEIPRGKCEKFPKVLARLRRGERLKFLFYGDSITTGCNASGTAMGGMIPPYMPPFDELVCRYLTEKYGACIEKINTAVGGMDTQWGVDNFEERVLSHEPDFIVIAFGMNDLQTPFEKYRAMIKDMIDRAHTALPDAEIMLVSSILPNDEAEKAWFANQRFFYRELLALEREYAFVATADVTTMHRQILAAGKRYRDMTANNINHPNDFLIRLYAQIILTTLLGENFDL
jgi:lysophospholipase L1-like esterase